MLLYAQWADFANVPPTICYKIFFRTPLMHENKVTTTTVRYFNFLGEMYHNSTFYKMYY